MNLLSGISVTCFAASYTVVLALEISRWFFRTGGRAAIRLAFAGAGVVAHIAYLGTEAYHSAGAAPLSSWYHWYLVVALVIAGIYVGVSIARPQLALGVFAMPLVIGLIAAAHFVASRDPFPASEASRAWAMVHGFSLLLGTVVVLIGFVAGIMYLLQANRLKLKKPPSENWPLPALEILERVNFRSVIISVGLLGLGVLSGILLNAADLASDKTGTRVEWRDPVVWTSGLLFVWLIAVSIFGAVYKPAMIGRKVAYLTLGSFVFLLLALAMTLWSSGGHTRRKTEPEKYETVAIAMVVVAATDSSSSRAAHAAGGHQ